MRSVFETASNTVSAPLEVREVIFLDRTSRSCFFLTIGAAGVGRPSERTRGQKSAVRGQSARIALPPVGLTSDI